MAVSNTPNIGLNLPSKSEQNWDTLLNQNFDKIDNEINNNNIDIGDKNELQTNNKDNLVSATNEIVSQMADIATNVSEFGAKGDWNGTTGTDDSTSIQNAINSKIGVVLGGNKSYKLTKKLTIPSGVYLKDFDFIADFIPVTSGDGVLELTGDHITINNIKIEGKLNNHTGIKVTNVNHSVIKNIVINNCKYDGIFATNTTNSKISNVQVENCGGTSLGGMIQIDEGCNNVLVELCTIDTTLGKGFVVGGDTNGTIDVTFSHCFAKNTVGEGFYPRRGSKRSTFYKCRVLKESTMPYDVNTFCSGIKCSRGGENIVFDQCSIEMYLGNDNAPPLRIQGCSYVTLKKCNLYGVTTYSVIVSWHPGDDTTNPITIATPSNHIKFVECVFDSQGNNGLKFNPSFGFNQLEDISIENCLFKNYMVAINSVQVGNLKIVNNVFEVSSYQTTDTQDTVLISAGSTTQQQYAQDTVIEGNVFESVSGYAIRTSYIQDVTINKNNIAGKLTTNTFVYLDNTKNGLIHNNVFRLSFNTCINLNINTQNIKVSENSFLGDGANTGIRQNGINQAVTGNYFDVATPLNPINGGIQTIVINNSNKRIYYDSAIPTTGMWNRGDIIYNLSPVASGKLGWVCVTTGTPGTWKAFGAIDV